MQLYLDIVIVILISVDSEEGTTVVSNSQKVLNMNFVVLIFFCDSRALDMV